MQLIIFNFLSGVPLPPHTTAFISGAVMFANIDVFSGEQFYEKHFAFKETEPVAQRFDEYDIGDQNFVNNSGSYLIMVLLIIIWHFASKGILKLSLKFSKYYVFRYIGMNTAERDQSDHLRSQLILVSETYYDLAIITFMGIRAMFLYGEFLEFFSTFPDLICSIITLGMLFTILYLPIRVYYVAWVTEGGPEFNK